MINKIRDEEGEGGVEENEKINNKRNKEIKKRKEKVARS